MVIGVAASGDVLWWKREIYLLEGLNLVPCWWIYDMFNPGYFIINFFGMRIARIPSYILYIPTYMEYGLGLW